MNDILREFESLRM